MMRSFLKNCGRLGCTHNADPEALREIKEMYKKYIVNWAKISGIVHNRTIAANLTVRESATAKAVLHSLFG